MFIVAHAQPMLSPALGIKAAVPLRNEAEDQL
jgi:hypothetical protein